MSPAASHRRAAPAVRAIEANVSIEDGRWLDALPGCEAMVNETLDVLARRVGLAGPEPTELGVTLDGDAAVRALNAGWRGKDKTTNVLSFPARELRPGEAPGVLLGDLVLAFETCRREADAENKRLADHVRHLVVHGALHCLGHDHADDREAEAMERLEVLILDDLGIPDPYRESDTDEEPDGA